MIVQIIGAFIAVMAFSIIFNVPKKCLPYCGMTGAIGWLVYLLGSGVVKEGFNSVFVAALSVALCSHVLARIFKAPVTVFLIPGILPLVPGVGMFRIVYYLFLDNGGMASYYLVYTLQAAGAIAIAIFIMDTIFRLFQKNK